MSEILQVSCIVGVALHKNKVTTVSVDNINRKFYLIE